MRIAGGAVLGAAGAKAVPLASVDSPTLAALVDYMDHESDNFTAEMLLKELGAVQADRGTTAAGVGVVTGLLVRAGVPMAGVRIVDGSGLSLLDRMTAGALGSLLSVMWNDPGVRPTLLASLPVAGRSGTLADRMRDTAARRRRSRQDRNHGQRVGALRLRRRPLRVLGAPERLACVGRLGPNGPGPVRDGPSAGPP